jgi:predicted secreted acid phosphatase
MFKKYFTICFLLFVSCASLAVEPQNLETAKQAVMKYYDSGAYDYDVQQAIDWASDYLHLRLAQNQEHQKLAIVLDIDETALKSYDLMKDSDFSSTPDVIKTKLNKSHIPALAPVLKLYNYALQNNVAVFFVTGRSENLQTITENVLNNAGYKNWTGLYLRMPKDIGRNTIEYKTSVRKKITTMGYDIVLSIGDQYNDLAGGYADRTIKLPNPFYIVP